MSFSPSFVKVSTLCLFDGDMHNQYLVYVMSCTPFLLPMTYAIVHPQTLVLVIRFPGVHSVVVVSRHDFLEFQERSLIVPMQIRIGHRSGIGN